MAKKMKKKGWNLILKDCIFKEINGKAIIKIHYLVVLFVNDNKEVNGDNPK
jgi:hypothetical protein